MITRFKVFPATNCQRKKIKCNENYFQSPGRTFSFLLHVFKAFSTRILRNPQIWQNKLQNKNLPSLFVEAVIKFVVFTCSVATYYKLGVSVILIILVYHQLTAVNSVWLHIFKISMQSVTFENENKMLLFGLSVYSFRSFKEPLMLIPSKFSLTLKFKTVILTRFCIHNRSSLHGLGKNQSRLFGIKTYNG